MRKFELVKEYENCLDLLPARSTKGSAGYDLRCAKDTIVPSFTFNMLGLASDVQAMQEINAHLLVGEGAVSLENSQKLIKKYNLKPTLVPTGLKVECPSYEYVKLVSRSSVPLKNLLIMANSEGIIDSDYYNNPDNEGHMYVQLINLAPFPILIQKGERIAQALFIPFSVTDGDYTDNTHTRLGGHGSTGIK